MCTTEIYETRAKDSVLVSVLASFLASHAITREKTVRICTYSVAPSVASNSFLKVHIALKFGVAART